MDATVFQYLISAVVTIVVTGCGVLSLWIKSRQAALEARVSLLEKQHQDCLKSHARLEAEWSTPWPSDPSEFSKLLTSTHDALIRSGLPFTMRDVLMMVHSRMDGKKNTKLNQETSSP